MSRNGAHQSHKHYNEQRARKDSKLQRAPRAEGRKKTMLDQLKNFNADRMDVEELVALHMFGKQFRVALEEQSVPVPVYVDDNLRALKHEIDNRMADRKAARIRELKQQRAGLATAQEKRDAIEKELAALGEPVA